jgi:hypothetical protein
MVGADIPHANVIRHDDENVGFLLLSCGWKRRAYAKQQCGKQRQSQPTN